MDAVEPLLRPLIALINRRIRGTTPALDLCRELAGKTLAVRVRDTALVACALIDPDGIRLVGRHEHEPDVIVCGSALALLSLGGEDPLASVRDGRVEISGDATTAEAFQKLIGLARPDLEEEAARLLGDSAAHRLGEIARGLLQWSRDAAQGIGESVGRRIGERDDLPTRGEADAFTRDVRELRDAAARLEARLNKLRGRTAGGPT